MVTIASAENALKTLYLGVVSEQLNTQVNPLLAKIKQSTTDGGAGKSPRQSSCRASHS